MAAGLAAAPVLPGPPAPHRPGRAAGSGRRADPDRCWGSAAGEGAAGLRSPRRAPWASRAWLQAEPSWSQQRSSALAWPASRGHAKDVSKLKRRQSR